MADQIGYAGALTAQGLPIAELFADQGDGTYARRVTTTSGAGVVGYRRYLSATGSPIPILFVDQGDGTYAELVSSAS